MSEFTLQDLVEELRACAGEAEGVDVDSVDIMDLPFLEIGYDSLALLQVTGILKRERDIQLDDDEVLGAETPRLLLEIINENLPSQRAA